MLSDSLFLDSGDLNNSNELNDPSKDLHENNKNKSLKNKLIGFPWMWVLGFIGFNIGVYFYIYYNNDLQLPTNLLADVSYAKVLHNNYLEVLNSIPTDQVFERKLLFFTKHAVFIAKESGYTKGSLEYYYFIEKYILDSHLTEFFPNKNINNLNTYIKLLTK